LLRALHREMQETPAATGHAAPLSAAPQTEPAGQYRGLLCDFLASGARLDLTPAGPPEVSVLVLLYNRAELTLRCLRALAEIRSPAVEIVLVDNASSDETARLLDRLDGVSILRNQVNLGFVRATNQAAAVAQGRVLLLLNNDAELLPGSLVAALRTLASSPQIGAVGGRLIAPDGLLQEAGSILWNDGSCLGYGRGAQPRDPPFMFQRDVDYCSAALLLTPRALWNELGGFDTTFAPAYYEDTDYCVRLWKTGRRVVFQPRMAALHFEFASSPSRSSAIAQQAERRVLFLRKHRDWLAQQPAPDPARALFARTHRAGPRILVLDDRVPRLSRGSGQPRALHLLTALVGLGWLPTLVPLSFPDDDDPHADVPPTVEVLTSVGAQGLAGLLEERRGFYSCILASRPHNMVRLNSARARLRTPLAVPIVYDAEAIFADREIAARRMQGERITPDQAQQQRGAELALARQAQVVLAVSAADAADFSGAGAPHTLTLGHCVDCRPTPAPFGARDGLLFVGALHEQDSPNLDSVGWFVRDVLPRLRSNLGADVAVDLVGATTLPEVLHLARPGVRVRGHVDDLTGLYGGARVFIAPTRFGAGLPFKVHHAAAHGLPVVATSLLAGQLGWQSGRELLAADDAASFAEACARLYRDPALWQRLRSAALDRVARDCCPAKFDATLAAALAKACS
jgi:GT2 family glycosyltransferase